MERLIVFGLLSSPLILISWRTLFNIRNHGFYRFFSWECILWLLVNNYKYWFDNPWSIAQLFSWLFLVFSLYLVFAGFVLLKKKGKPEKIRDKKVLYQFEKTSVLIDNGIFHYIRHPLYSSLLFLSWGIFLKHPTVLLFILVILSSIFLYITAKIDEKECIIFFGKKYREYRKRSKMFIPFLF